MARCKVGGMEKLQAYSLKYIETFFKPRTTQNSHGSLPAVKDQGQTGSWQTHDLRSSRHLKPRAKLLFMLPAMPQGMELGCG